MTSAHVAARAAAAFLVALSTAGCPDLLSSPLPEDAGTSSGNDAALLYLPEVTMPRNLTASRGEFPDKIVLKWVAGTPGPWTVRRCISLEIPCPAMAKYADLPEGATEFVDTAPPPNTLAHYQLFMTLTSVNETSDYSGSQTWGYAAGTLAGPTNLTATTDTRTDGIVVSVTQPWLWKDLDSAHKGSSAFFRALSPKGPWSPLHCGGGADPVSCVDQSAAGGVTYYYKAQATYDPPTMIGGMLNSADSNIASGRRLVAADGSTSWGFSGTPISAGNGREHGLFRWARQAAVAPDGSVYVAESVATRVQRFSAKGEFLDTISDNFAVEAVGSRPFIHPVGVAVDSTGTVFVADNDADSGGSRARIVRLAADGTFQKEWNQVGEKGIGPSSLWQIAVDAEGNVWGRVAGIGLVKWDRDGKTLLETSGAGPKCSQQLGPGCRIQPAVGGGVWVLCGYSLQRFDAAGQPADCGLWLKVQAPGGFAVLPDGRIYVGDTATLDSDPTVADRKMLHRIGTDGAPLASWGPYGIGPEKLRAPESIAIAPDGSLYVVDGRTRDTNGSTVGNDMIVHLSPF